jgi:hypothetical protein
MNKIDDKAKPESTIITSPSIPHVDYGSEDQRIANRQGDVTTEEYHGYELGLSDLSCPTSVSTEPSKTPGKTPKKYTGPGDVIEKINGGFDSSSVPTPSTEMAGFFQLDKKDPATPQNKEELITLQKRYVEKKQEELDSFNMQISQLKGNFTKKMTSPNLTPAKTIEFAEEFSLNVNHLENCKKITDEELSLAFKTLRGGIGEFHGGSAIFPLDSATETANISQISVSDIMDEHKEGKEGELKLSDIN